MDRMILSRKNKKKKMKKMKQNQTKDLIRLRMNKAINSAWQFTGMVDNPFVVSCFKGRMPGNKMM